MRLGICTSPEHLQAASHAGFDFAEMGCSTLQYAQDDAAFASVRTAFRQAPLPIEAFNVFLPPTLKVTGPVVDEDSLRRHMDRVLRRASEVGASIIVFGSGGARRVPEGFPLEKARSQFMNAARLAAETADRYGVTVVLEPLYKRACNFFNRTDQGLAYVEGVAHPRLRLLADLFHMGREAEPFENLVKAGLYLAHIHLPTPPLPDIGWGEAGPFDFERFFAALKKADYQGRISVEDNNGLLSKSSLPLAESFRFIREWLAERLGA